MSTTGGDLWAMDTFARASDGDATNLRSQAGELDLALASLLAACPDGYRPRIHGGPSEVVDWAEALRATGLRPGEVAAALQAADEAGIYPDRVPAFVAARVTDSKVADLLSELMGAAEAYGEQHGAGALADVDHTAGAVGQHGAPGSGSQGDPVDTSTGHLWRVDEDLQLAGPGVGVQLRRSYSSASRRVGVFGRGWSSLLDVRVVPASDDGWTLLADDGWRQHHRREGEELVPPRGCTTTLEELDERVSAMLEDGTVWRFGEDRWLASIGTAAEVVWTVERFADAVVLRGAGRELVAELSGDRVTRVRTAGRTIRYRHDGERLLQVEHPDRTVRYGYDRDGRCTDVERDGTSLLRTEYGDDGRVVWQQDAVGGVWRFAYDGQTTRVTEPSGRVVADRHDEGVLVRRAVDGVEVPIVHEQVPKVLDDAVGEDLRDAGLLGARITGTDRSGRPVAASAPGREVAVDWGDADGLRSAQVRGVTGVDVDVEVVGLATGGSRRLLRAGGVEGVLERDRWGDLVGWGDLAADERATWRLGRDVLRRPVELTAPDGGVTTWTYDAAGRLAERRAPLGVTSLTWSPDGALVGVAQPMRTVAFEHDGAGRLSSMDLGGGALHLLRGDDGTLRGWDDPTGATRVEVSEGRIVGGTDAGGRWSALRDTDGRGLGREGLPDVWLRTGGDRPELEVDGATVLPWIPEGETWLGGGGAGGEITVDVDLPARTFVQRLPNGVEIAAVYDSAGLLVEQRAVREGEVLFEERLEHDRTGRTTAWHHADTSWHVDHDANGRMRSVEVDGGRGWSATHDTAGRRLSWSTPSTAVAATYDARGLLVRVADDEGRERTLTYDGGGRVVTDDGWAFRYDATGRLVGATHDGRDVAIEHDLDLRGLRVATRVRVGGALVKDLRWIWDLSARVPRPLYVRDEISGRRAVVRHDAQGYPQAVIDLDDDSRSRWFVTDHLGTPRVELDAEGRVVTTHATAPWGDVAGAPAEAPSGPIPGGDEPLVRFGFAGALVDDATGHLYLLSRQYDPTLGRFLSPDPVLAPIGTHAQDPYGYCDGRPLQLRDPDGRWGISLPNPLDALGKIGEAASWVGQKASDAVAFANDVWDANEHWLGPTFAVMGVTAMVIGTVATAGTLPAAIGFGLGVVGAAGSAASAVDNFSERKYAAGVLDTIGLVGGVGTLARAGDASRFGALLGRAGWVDDMAGATDDAALLGTSLASLGVGSWVNPLLFAGSQTLAQSCAPA